MAKTDARFIDGIENIIAQLFAPAISENQSVTCYVDEAMTPYYIHGDNIVHSSSS